MKYRLTAVCMFILLASHTSADPVDNPDYIVSVSDAQWDHAGGGIYTVATSAEDYAAEQWERPVEDTEWSDSGGTRTSSGRYYAYGDVTQGQFGIDDDFFYVAITVAGDYFHLPGEGEDQQGLKGKYHVYFDTGNGDSIALDMQIDDGTALESSFVNGAAKMYNLDTDNELDSYEVWARASGLVVELALNLASVGLEKADFESLDWLFAGVAISNPGSAAKLPVKDHFVEAIGSGVEYDTVVGPLAIPEPAVIGLLAMVSFAFLFVRRLFR